MLGFEQRLFVGTIVFFLLLIVLRAVRRQQLGVSLGLLWTMLFVAALVILAAPGLLKLTTALVGAEESVSAMTLGSLVVMTLFLFYFSVIIQRLERRYADLVRAVGIMERRLRTEGLTFQQHQAAPPEPTKPELAG